MKGDALQAVLSVGRRSLDAPFSCGQGKRWEVTTVSSIRLEGRGVVSIPSYDLQPLAILCHSTQGILLALGLGFLP
jgi:hypothetical protein